MAANVVFRQLSDDEVPANPLLLVPYTLYRGMAVDQEYHMLYVKNEGDAVLSIPSHTLNTITSSTLSNHKYRKLTGSTKDATGDNVTTAATPGLANSVATIYIPYAAPVSWWQESPIGPTAIPDLSNQMPLNRCYDLWTKYRCNDTNTTIGAGVFRHSIGGS